MKRELESMFTDMSKEDLLNFFSDCDVEVEEVSSGKGGFYLEGKKLECNFCNQRIDEIKHYITTISDNVNNTELYKNINSIRNMACIEKFNIKDYVDFDKLQVRKSTEYISYKKDISISYEEELICLKAA